MISQFGLSELNSLLTPVMQDSLNLETSKGHMVDFKWGVPLVDMLMDLSYGGDRENQVCMATPEEMSFDYANEALKVWLIIHSMEFQHDFLLPLVENLKGLLLLGDTANLVPGQ